MDTHDRNSATVNGDVGPGSVVGNGSVEAGNIAGRDILHLVINLLGQVAKVDTPPRVRARALIVLLGGAITVVAVTVLAIRFILPLFLPPSASITDPKNNGVVPHRTIVHGTSQWVAESQTLWAMVYPHEAPLFYPHGEPATVAANGDWTSGIQVGAENETGETFDIIVVLADEEGRKALEDYVEKSRTTGSWKGLSELPRGVKEYDRITVTRQ